MKFPFHVYLVKLEEVATAAAAKAPGLWASPRAAIQSLRRIEHQDIDHKDVVVRRTIAEYVPAEVMHHIVESQPRVLLAVIGVVRALAERLAKQEDGLREARAMLQRARRWVPDPKLNDEIDTMLRLPVGRARVEVEKNDDRLSSIDLEIEVPE